MKKIFTFLTICMLAAGALFAQVSAADSEKAFKILDSCDEVMADHGDYSATMTLVVEQPGKPKETLQYKVFLRTKDELMSMVQIFPEADKGIGYLRDGDNMWAYDPIGRKFTHSSLKESLGDSDVKIDDITKDDDRWRTNFKVIELKDGKLGKYPVNIITLEAVTTDPSYKFMKLYIRKDVPLILKEEDFSGSKRLMRTILMPKYGKVPTGYVALQTILRDELNPGENTQQMLSDITYDRLQDKVFTKAYLEGLN